MLMSAVEYALHRWPMHSARLSKFVPALRRTFEQHAVLHHGRYYRQSFSSDPDPAARHLNIDLHPGFSLFGLSPVWVPLFLVHPAAGLAMAAVITLHAWTWTAIHREMHDPAGRWFANTRVYRYLRDYHERHHAHPGSNFNVVLPGVDWLFGTYRGPTI